MTEKTKGSQLFPKWMNSIPYLALPALVFTLSIVIFVVWYWFSPENYNVGYKPEQPIPFSHRLHAGELGLDCRYCHFTVEKSSHAAIPPAELCLNCHKVIKTDSPHIQKLTQSVVNGEPIEWVKVHKLPDYSYFDHSVHLNAGVSCVSCHGRIDQMDVVKQVEPLSMSWCLECHRDPAPNLRPKDKITDLGWEPSDKELREYNVSSKEELGKLLKERHKIYPREDCNTCHR